MLIKVGTLDDPGVFEGPELVTWTSEIQKFHLLPPNVPAHPELPRPKGSERPATEVHHPMPQRPEQATACIDWVVTRHSECVGIASDEGQNQTRDLRDALSEVRLRPH